MLRIRSKKVKGKRMVVIIAGSSTIDDYMLVEQAIRESEFEITEVVSGGQRSYDREKRLYYGADYFGELWAKKHNRSLKVFRAKWGELSHPGAVIKTNKRGEKYDAMAGFRRNEDMARYVASQLTGGLIAVWKNRSPGTADMIKRAQSHGLRVFILEV